MKNSFKTYGICWIIVLGLFTTVSLVSAHNTVGLENVNANFWIGYFAIVLTLVGNIVCSYRCLNQDSTDKVFLNIPVFMISFSALVISLISGTVTMAVSSIPYWIGILINIAILAFFIIAVIMASATASAISNIDSKIKSDSSFIRNLTTDASLLMSACADVQIRNEIKKVYEALRYSDPVSKKELKETESAISNKYEAFSMAVSNGEKNEVINLAAEIVALISKRNNELKRIK